ncbi:MAG: STAS domain-containing protein [Planctomycetes bacterium]|nr:STAS domain-containing protein [Planctomycetota bacterium]
MAPVIPGHLLRSRYVELTARGGILTATVTTPALGLREAPAVAEVLVDAIDEFRGTLRYIVLDLSSVAFMNSTGLGMCIDARNRAANRGAGAVAVGLGRDIEALFELMRLDRFFQF